ncbi:PPK2 family polyphosphate:nucleotide phosphotransferase [Nocardioides cavernae]|uniref:PPK2 family polyphosphate:nucleotide phosphotransferase n=1 Tax=Nocardioides cavernae TaxID=1921566 RepID=A0A7Y9KVE5_9ACTN|nr:PPK2 family polyphosphate kinase [Nocardioides cavernae]NYE38803.1 PPK2 family polyphosphate:nucleotide phosphotransferase [Nocardioides cavernae]
MTSPATSPIADALRLDGGPVDLTAIETDAAPGFDGRKADGVAALAAMAPELGDLQERLWAERTAGSQRRVLVVLQGMDTSGKGGVLRHTIGLVDPQGVRVTSFKAPTEEERAHDFLWRIERGLPAPGYIGVFDRSHYEDVLIARVRGLAEPEEVERRYGAINELEARLVDEGFSIIKCMLHISADEQKERLAERLANPEKHWKYNPGDLDERALWPAYREAYEIALERTHTDHAPWHVVPSDKKWFRNLAVGQLLLDTLRGLDLQWPAADFDVAAETRRLAEEDPVR